ncbi:hypothetical protein RIF29_18755 [Crotalaria pallida]|uniref:CASP-like protein n=1 Tax=Crotalaria pallida TaxID=3830 RepID=A0AAN9F2Q9_CROPI
MRSMSLSESISIEMQQNSEEQDFEHNEEQQHQVSKKVTIEKVEEGTGKGNGGSNVLTNKKETKLNIALLGLRISAFVLCLKSFAVLAANEQKYKIQGYKLFHVSFDMYKEFKYSLSVSVIAFAYSLLQICDLMKYLITKKHTMDPKLRGYINFAMDQILTYFLMSASSSAATLACYEDKMGKHLFLAIGKCISGFFLPCVCGLCLDLSCLWFIAMQLRAGWYFDEIEKTFGLSSVLDFHEHVSFLEELYFFKV